MGSSSSKFRKYLQNGDEYAALQVFQHSFELQHNLDPNSSYGDTLKHNTPLHLAAYHAMKPLLRIFLTKLQGNPNKQNASGESALHLVCQGDSPRSERKERRAICLNLMLQLSYLAFVSSEDKLSLDCLDNEGNTALHFAAASGLMKCVELLVSHGANLFVENKSSETACDLAAKNKHEDIAQFLEAKMIFFLDTTVLKESLSTEEAEEEITSGLRAQDLLEAKDQLLVETSDMLHVPLFTAEVLLRNYEWSRQSLLDAWMRDPVTCCNKVGITPPSSAVNFSATQDSLKACCEQIQQEYHNETLNSPVHTVVVKEEIMCGICMKDMSTEETLQVPCLHQFCQECWKEYLTIKISDGDTQKILCPAFECPFIVPVDVIEKIVSEEMIKRYSQFDIKAFVESNPTMKWCPYPACAMAVKLPETEKISEELLAISFSTPPSLSHSVDCGNGHYFCWECLGEAHAPCGCEKWKEWHNKIAEIKPQELKNTYVETEQAENSLWLVTNSKPCPNCKCPIQRTEGCNHMKCTKCKYEFCWVCLEAWKKHNYGTGGYFRCNRHDAVKRAEVKTEALINEAEEHNKHMQELKRFLQYYTRFKNHENKFKYEETFVKPMQEKMNILVATLAMTSSPEADTSFLEDAIYELLRARRILCGTYVHGFYLEDNGYNKTIFEYLQKELEEVTEKLSESITHVYLQTPQSKVVQMTTSVKRKRLDLLNAVHKGLTPPETPTSQRKKRRNRLPGLMGMDPVEDMNGLLDSLENVDPNDPWVINRQGKHTNVAAVCDWPDYDSDEDVIANSVLASVLGTCSREGCKRPRVKNRRTGDIHEFCSLSCKHWNVLKSSSSDKVTAVVDPNMDYLIALELSKLQMPEGRVSDENEHQNSEPSLESSHETAAKWIPNAEEDHISHGRNQNEFIDSPDSTSSHDEEQMNNNILKSSSDENFVISEITFKINAFHKNEGQDNTLDISSLNLYSKNCEQDSKNFNVIPKNLDSKTEKELFRLEKNADVPKVSDVQSGMDVKHTLENT
ncbi:ankyrin repeat and IBR domain-containing protein 1 isoform X1 [Parasteatoda tepidariorum]|uniref:ankyrin repeat and IBR domain-containing protein 1 isoform X1 n=1 Tax=Parasteatoda tepidariorum TaxID=114398 RepID=UPI001C71AC1A|nr:ankyrin repeat and IBR domain-containing protein 1 isoform X1 [Parasteatoda tepidariorum]XP_042897393.1 ankyrin repeat and IBR domain-containing protein 1 isoform X1 [Parasteatoda tepidariorum]XP_042897394.1 ankyrin repeat and IBR domain-containing protein 1 isoform X1 [Parasteatoda tepidariorum]XP_042897395.1 ankyrin repeat and IBR domain-containing protein 1 isoform X1 [Parasteatoda tepidariorum]